MNMLKDIKHQFMAFRNGIVADTLRKAGLPHKIIFGLQLPDISRIARSLRETGDMEHTDFSALADELWNDSDVRESRLLACYIFNPGAISPEKALELASSVRSVEEADILSFRLLRHVSDARSILEIINKKASADAPGGFSPRRAVANALARNLADL